MIDLEKAQTKALMAHPENSVANVVDITERLAKKAKGYVPDVVHAPDANGLVALPNGGTAEFLESYVAKGKGTPPDAARLEAMKNRIKTQPSATISTAEHIREPMVTSHKVNLGITCLIAGMTGFGAVQHLSNGLKADENGKRNIGQLGLGAVEALLTVGLAFLALEMHKPQQAMHALKR